MSTAGKARKSVSGQGAKDPVARVQEERRRVSSHAHQHVQRLVDSIEDYVDLDNCFRGSTGVNAHEAYGYFYQRKLAELVGDFIERS